MDLNIIKNKKKTNISSQIKLRNIVNLLTISYGTTAGWPSSSFLLLESIENAPLPTGPLTIDELTWISSILCLGGIFGTLSIGWLISYIGKKKLLLVLAIPQLVGRKQREREEF